MHACHRKNGSPFFSENATTDKTRHLIRRDSEFCSDKAKKRKFSERKREIYEITWNARRIYIIQLFDCFEFAWQLSKKFAGCLDFACLFRLF